MPTSRPFIGSIIITKQILQTINSFDKKQHQNIFQLFQNLFEDVYICFIVNVFIRCKCFLLLSTKFCTTSNNMGVKTDCAKENEVYPISFLLQFWKLFGKINLAIRNYSKYVSYFTQYRSDWNIRYILVKYRTHFLMEGWLHNSEINNVCT